MRLFKYLTPERTDVLKNQSIRFTQAKHLNDPFEWLPFVKRLMSEAAADNYYRKFVEPPIAGISDLKLDVNKWPKEILEQIPEDTLELLRNLPADVTEQISKLTVTDGLSLIPQVHPENFTKLILSGTSEQLNTNISELLKNSWDKYFGVLSLTQSNRNIPMWSHYAQNHEGFVIEFDPKNKFFQNENESRLTKQLREVKYSNRRKIDLLEGISDEAQILNRIADEVFFTKSNQWKDEEEIRVLDKLMNNNRKIQANGQEIYLFDFEPEAIKAIYFGVNIADKTRTCINSILDSDFFRHVERHSGELDMKEYKINFH